MCGQQATLGCGTEAVYIVEGLFPRLAVKILPQQQSRSIYKHALLVVFVVYATMKHPNAYCSELPVKLLHLRNSQLLALFARHHQAVGAASKYAGTQHRYSKQQQPEAVSRFASKVKCYN